ncbi:MAG: hypothetical protein GX915_04330 [Clostridiales bacterium]|nr:hypothetical protein [Clostridiales bacterium]
MCEKQSLLSKIITNIKASVNDYSLRKITADRPLSYEDVKYDMYIHRETVGDYARRAYGRRLAKRFIGLFTGVTYL